MVVPSQTELMNWCKGESLDVRHALLLYGVPVDIKKSEIEETAETIKALGKVVVRRKMFHPQVRSLMMLRKLVEKQCTIQSPRMVVLKKNYSHFTRMKTFRVCTPREANSNPEAIIRAVSDMMVSTNKSPDNHSYRRLKAFSGVSPTPIGEESLDNWLEQVTLLVDEGECSDKEKQRRILESLKGPALEIIQAVRMTQPDASPCDYIEAIESIFGTAESGEELYLSFQALHQQPGECMSDFLRRLERSKLRREVGYLLVMLTMAHEEFAKEVLGEIRWKGPDPLSIAPGAKYYATCKVDRHRAPSKELVLIDAPTALSLQASVLVQPGVLPDADVDSNSFTVLLQK
uniref:Uncharacterized protein n=1 Tax=Gouania willdenowi TaxID=441366 RepID=A0A8C5G1B2_GOUWI